MRLAPLALVPALALTLAAVALPTAAAAQVSGWGVRAGLADDPDQFVVGVSATLEQTLLEARLQPSVELGSGDDADTFALTLPAQAVLRKRGDWTPYLGVGLVLALVDPTRGESDFDIGGTGMAGVEWAVDAGRAVSFELGVGGSEAFELRLLVGYRF